MDKKYLIIFGLLLKALLAVGFILIFFGVCSLLKNDERDTSVFLAIVSSLVFLVFGLKLLTCYFEWVDSSDRDKKVSDVIDLEEFNDDFSEDVNVVVPGEGMIVRV